MLLTIGYLREGSKFVGLKSSPYRSVLPSRAFTVIRIGGFQPASSRREISPRSSSMITLPVASRTTEIGARIRRRVGVDHKLPGRRQIDRVIAILRREQLLAFSIEADAIEITEVRILPFLLPDALEIDRATILIDPEHLRHIAFTGRDAVFLEARASIVQVQSVPSRPCARTTALPCSSAGNAS